MWSIWFIFIFYSRHHHHDCCCCYCRTSCRRRRCFICVAFEMLCPDEMCIAGKKHGKNVKWTSKNCVHCACPILHFRHRENLPLQSHRNRMKEREHAFRIVAQRICTILYCGQKYRQSEIYIIYAYRLCIHEVRECFATILLFILCFFCLLSIWTDTFCVFLSFILILFSWNVVYIYI